MCEVVCVYVCGGVYVGCVGVCGVGVCVGVYRGVRGGCLCVWGMGGVHVCVVFVGGCMCMVCVCRGSVSVCVVRMVWV